MRKIKGQSGWTCLTPRRGVVGPERGAFVDKASYFWRYTVDTLAGMPTRTLTRPMVLLLGHGLLREHMVRHPDDCARVADVAAECVDRSVAFEPQKVRATKRFTWLAPSAASVAVVAGVWWLVQALY